MGDDRSQATRRPAGPVVVGAILVAGFTLLLTSCGGGGSSPQAASDTTARRSSTTTVPATTTTPPTTAPPTTTPSPVTTSGTSTDPSGGSGDPADTGPPVSEDPCTATMNAVGYLAQQGASSEQQQGAVAATLDACTHEQWLAAIGAGVDGGAVVPPGTDATKALDGFCATDDTGAQACQAGQGGQAGQ